VRAPNVHSFARPAHATDPRDHGDFPLLVAEVQSQDRMAAFLETLHALKESFLMENPGDLDFERGGRHLHSRVSPPHGVSNPGDHVSEGIRHRHRVTSSI